MIMGVIFCLSYDLFHAINFNVYIILMKKGLFSHGDVVMKLQVPAKELCTLSSDESNNAN